MGNKLTYNVLFVFFLFSLSCSDDIKMSDSDFSIEFGFACGWCGGTANLIIEKGKLSYERRIPCGENEGTETNSRALTEAEWDEITSSFDYNYLARLDNSACNVCVDGCDEIIRIKKQGETHELRYNPSETIEGLQNFQELLRKYFAEFQPEN